MLFYVVELYLNFLVYVYVYVQKNLIQSINKKEEITKENIRKAEMIGFKNVPDKIVLTDQYGFIQNDKSS